MADALFLFDKAVPTCSVCGTMWPHNGVEPREGRGRVTVLVCELCDATAACADYLDGGVLPAEAVLDQIRVSQVVRRDLAEVKRILNRVYTSVRTPGANEPQRRQFTRDADPQHAPAAAP